jgi:hypothetical protein
MEAALNFEHTSRGAELLLHHCAAIGRLDEPRAPARSRLDQALGPELAQLLVRALVRRQVRGSSSP